MPRCKAVIRDEILTPPPEGRSPPGILLTCKQTCKEAIQCWDHEWASITLTDLKTGIDHIRRVNPMTKGYRRWSQRNEDWMLGKISSFVLRDTRLSLILAKDPCDYLSFYFGGVQSVRERKRLVQSVMLLAEQHTDLKRWRGALSLKVWEQPSLCLVDSIETLIRPYLEVVPSANPSTENDFRRLSKQIGIIIQERRSLQALHSTSSEITR